MIGTKFLNLVRQKKDAPEIQTTMRLTKEQGEKLQEAQEIIKMHGISNAALAKAVCNILDVLQEIPTESDQQTVKTHY